MRGASYGGGGGGGGPGAGGTRTGTVIGGSPGICTTVWPNSGGAPGGGTATGGGGGAGAMPLLIWMVMIEPGIVWPDGDVPTTVPLDEPLLTGVA